MGRNKIVVSAINLHEGGPLRILQNNINELSHNNYCDYDIVFFIHDINLINNPNKDNIKFIELKKARESYFYRLYYEFAYFYNYSKQNKVHLWLSLHDISPRVKAVSQAVYCHNAIPFRSIGFKDLYRDPKMFMFTLFYKNLYRLNINSNKYIIVQQGWIRDKFTSTFGLGDTKVIVAYPNVKSSISVSPVLENKKNVFFYPAIPRSFKNHEIIFDAINEIKDLTFEVIVTFDGSENQYAHKLYKKYKHLKQIKFMGAISFERVQEIYDLTKAVIFPSKLETWGLPIVEAKNAGLPLLLVDLDYARETLGDYNRVNFFKQNDFKTLASLMHQHIDEKINYTKNVSKTVKAPHTNSWEAMYNLLLK